MCGSFELEPHMMMRDPEVIRTALIGAAMVQAGTIGYEQALRSLLVQQFASMSSDELAIIAKELGI
jgi:hypothetical protein